MKSELFRQSSFLEQNSIDGNQYNTKYTIQPYSELLETILDSSVTETMSDEELKLLTQTLTTLKDLYLSLTLAVCKRGGLIKSEDYSTEKLDNEEKSIDFIMNLNQMLSGLVQSSYMFSHKENDQINLQELKRTSCPSKTTFVNRFSN